MDTSRGRGLTGLVLDDRYRVGPLLARGGMSTVYRGVDLRLDRQVAIKVMSPAYADDPAFLARFEREARAAAALDHPGVVGVYDRGRDGEHVFLVMELVSGGTLRDLLREYGSLSVPVALSVLEPLLGALGAAHAAGLVHRDVKPENVLISTKGEVKVADFGLVRAVTSQTMATGDVILGTVAYLSPEQVATGAADARSDVYAAGIVGYEMLTGATPFAGDNPMSVAYQHVHSDVPPVADGAPGVPASIAAVIDAATRRDPLARPRDAAAFLTELVTARARVGLRRVPVPTPAHREPSGRLPTGQHGAPPHGAATGHPEFSGQTARPVGPQGTRAVAAAARMTAASPPNQPDAGGPGSAGQGRDRGRGRGGRSGPDTGPPYHDSLQARRRRRWRTRLIVIAVLLVLAAAAAYGGWWLGSGRWTSIPVVQGMSQAAAVALVRGADLSATVRTAHDDTTPSGKVIDLDPPGGSRQLRGSTVQMQVSLGRPQVPNLDAGMDAQSAIAAISAADLEPVLDAGQDVYDDTVPLGSVIRTAPPAGTSLPIGGPVQLILSRGPAPVTVPSVAGKEPEDANNKLLVSGLGTAPAKTVFDADHPAGTVLGTDPAQGRTVPHGSGVSLVLATSVTVPDLRGVGAADAVRTLTENNFTAQLGAAEFDPGIDAGDVVRTVPAAGTRIDPADPRVSLVTSNAVTVPRLTDGTLQQARDTLSRLHLDIQVSSWLSFASSSVTSQNPIAGSRVAPGSAVTVTAWP